jgi:hypothetical protein
MCPRKATCVNVVALQMRVDPRKALAAHANALGRCVQVVHASSSFLVRANLSQLREFRRPQRTTSSHDYPNGI